MTKKDDVLKEFIALPGIGMSKAKLLYKGGFESIKDLKKASVEDMVAIKGVNEKLAKDIHSHFHPDDALDPVIESAMKDEPKRKAEDKSKPKSKAKKTEDKIFMERGLDLYKKGKWGQALQSLKEALRVNPTNENAHMLMGDIYRERGKLERAMESYEVLIEINPKNDEPWVKYGDALMALDRGSEAITCYKKALEINEDNDQARERLMENERIKTYVEGLDETLDGGIPARHIVLVCGRAGSMKSSFCYSILYNLAKQDKMKGVYLTLEQSRSSLQRHMKKLGFDAEGASNLVVNDLDDMVVIDIAHLRKETSITELEGIDWLNSIITQVQNYKKMFGCEVVVLDSLSALYSLTTFKNPRSELFFFFEKLRDLGITVFIITEMFDPEKEIFGTYGVEEFLADSIFHLKTEKTDNRTNLFLGIVKMRETNHGRDYNPLIVDKNGFAIVHD
ncbi:MAG: tetratricopeptide repeat protein [Thermoplasmata archaeon]|nr:tetratricopeptide repeat protein [Thermoplasmata archaeon]